ncbi:MAG: hypothetical protein LWY06_15355 [Firmicutes bacterium]|nr:hypothetical protein [Bacillota bacterium]
MFTKLIEFRNKCIEKRTPIEIAVAMLLAKLASALVSNVTALGVILNTSDLKSFMRIQDCADVVFWISLILILASIFADKVRFARFIMITYTILMTLQLVVNVVILVTGAHTQIGKPLYYLWDVALVYLMNIFVFTAWYWIADTSNERGFIFPTVNGAGKEHKELHFIDYLFIAFNVSATFGPANEIVLSVWTKVLMMCQTGISMIIVVVLAARAASLT